MTQNHTDTKPGFKAKFREEMRLYGYLSLYLFVCFTVLNVYEASIKGETTFTVTHFTSALISALLIGKFILIGKVIGVGSRLSASKLFHRVALKSLAFVLLLIVFKIIEELVVGWLHDHSAMHSMSEMMGRGLLANLAPIFVMMLVLIPLIAFVEVERGIGKENMAQLKKGGVIDGG